MVGGKARGIRVSSLLTRAITITLKKYCIFALHYFPKNKIPTPIHYL